MKPKFTTKHVGRAAYVRRARKLMSKLKPLDRWQQERTLDIPRGPVSG